MADTAGERRRARKKVFRQKFEKLLESYQNCLIVGIDNVGSFQMQKVRKALRGRAEMVMGKNTLIRMIMRECLSRFPTLEALISEVRGNVGLVFTNDDLKDIRSKVVEFKVPAAAKSGSIAPADVRIPAGPTGLDPGQTSFFQALNIATKIVKGSIEISNEVLLVRKGEKVTASAVALLSKLDIKPFFYGLTVRTVFENGALYPVDVLDVSDDDLLAKFMNGVSRLSAISMGLSYPTQVALPHLIGNAFRKLLAISAATNYTFKEAEALKEAAVAAPAASVSSSNEEEKVSTSKEAKGKKEVEEEPVEEEDVGLGGMFD